MDSQSMPICLWLMMVCCAMQLKFRPPASQDEQGSYYQRESPIHHSNVMHWSSSQNVRSRLGHRCVPPFSSCSLCLNLQASSNPHSPLGMLSSTCPLSIPSAQRSLTTSTQHIHPRPLLHHSRHMQHLNIALCKFIMLLAALMSGIPSG